MIGRRTIINLIAFMSAAVLLVVLGITTLVVQPHGGAHLTLDFENVSGINVRNDVTMRGVPVGHVTAVSITPSGFARLGVELQPGVQVPTGTKAAILRRSPIGDITLELTPGTGPPLPDGARIGLQDTTPPPDPELTIEVLARVLHSVPSEDLGTLVHELAVGLNGRGEDLATLSEVGADLPEQILQVKAQLESLIRHGPQVTGTFADNADALADDLVQTALLADILRDRRYDLVALSRNGADFAQVANDLLGGEKANLACLLRSFGTLNATLAAPDHRDDLETTLELNHYFFDGVEQLVMIGKDSLAWFRVQLLPPQAPPGREYPRRRPPPDIYPGNACHSRYGDGVGPVTQPDGFYVAPGSEVHPGR